MLEHEGHPTTRVTTPESSTASFVGRSIVATGESADSRAVPLPPGCTPITSCTGPMAGRPTSTTWSASAVSIITLCARVDGTWRSATTPSCGLIPMAYRQRSNRSSATLSVCSETRARLVFRPARSNPTGMTDSTCTSWCQFSPITFLEPATSPRRRHRGDVKPAEPNRNRRSWSDNCRRLPGRRRSGRGCPGPVVPRW
ncbi:MAG: hypothetical protein ACI9C1_000745 [Candidatus Aldehydirespiratoraceae bacterium]|jgi:hypothetical protein